ncbi:hypothetical protein ACGFNU_32545 [Spirillospora sp. NPDC048911]|uniref:hypothetical protein n=1 Tax=Spirillospora sp. NPDC048911 TaxID=3364527 RepID=UPI003711A13F
MLLADGVHHVRHGEAGGELEGAVRRPQVTWPQRRAGLLGARRPRVARRHVFTQAVRSGRLCMNSAARAKCPAADPPASTTRRATAPP